ncbi:glycosyltransferase [Acetobacter sp. AN02]|uniref:glycosyltransferase n=1 Tax=Acetobacter sp. AN02 TaxID=2894186 RepID=UPI0024344ECA|nr:glycosyltransferase [Acetobacter sp. AN02]MDG6095727.1 glycosyltransferase [Acetobacter sp. AN02]
MPRRKAFWDYFDFDWCKIQNPEIESILDDINSLEFENIIEIFGKYGYSPNPYFDEKWYVERYKEVKDLISSGEYISGFDHYRKKGFLGKNPHWLFSEEYYIKYKDISSGKYLTDHYLNGYDHYLSVGDSEFRSGSWFFDPREYIKSTSNVIIRNPFDHYLRSDSLYANSMYFDHEYYIKTYPEIHDVIKEKKFRSVLHHYLSNKNYNPSAYFSEKYYLGKYPDIQGAIDDGRFRCSYEHFLIYGIKERRSPNENIDLDEYYNNSRVQYLIKDGRFPDVFISYCLQSEKNIDVNHELIANEDITKLSFEKKSEYISLFLSKNKIDFRYKIPKVTVVIVVYNNFSMTLNSLFSLRSSYDDEMQVIIVDSGSSDETLNIEKYFYGLDVLRFDGNIGFLRGCNAAIPHILSPFTVFLNNDAEIQFGAIDKALSRAQKYPETGAIGAKLVRTNGMLQEAGSVIWRDGSVVGYLRGQSPDVPEANFVRKVDFCSGAFLFVRTSLLRQLNGFREDYIPAYYEETDLCVRIWEAGYEVVYDPSIVIIHYEYGTSDIKSGSGYINRNRNIFISKNKDFLSKKYIKSDSNIHRARSVSNKNKKNVLFIDDRIPLKYLGSGFSRANDIINTMSEISCSVTVFPIYKPTEPTPEVYQDFPDDVEIIWDRDLKDLEEFLGQRAGMYDVIWISRTHNAHRLISVIEKVSHLFYEVKIIVDTEAVSSVRDEQKENIDNIPEENRISLDRKIQNEFECLSIANDIVAVNYFDKNILNKNGFMNVSVLGHLQRDHFYENKWEERSDILFVGAIHDYNSPNYDSLLWFFSNVWPDLERELPDNVCIKIAGYIRPGLSLSGLSTSPRVKFFGKVENLRNLYNNSRVFIAPTRYAAGIPYKIHEAASYGIPIVASDILGVQLGWEDGKEAFLSSTYDPEDFRKKILNLYYNKNIWNTIRQNEIENIRKNNNFLKYKKDIKRIIFK